MKKQYKISLPSQVEADSEEQARQMFAALVQSTEVWISEWQHPDEQFYGCAPPPAGYSLLSLNSDYTGSHEEYGEGEQTLFFAVPTGAAVPEISLSHGHNGAQWDDLSLLPTGTLEWVGHKGEWVPFVYQPATE